MDANGVSIEIIRQERLEFRLAQRQEGVQTDGDRGLPL
jgi:hypothetical protein